ncbi:MAG: ATP-binding cassette domain-containing protein [Actinomycetota bacterium]
MGSSWSWGPSGCGKSTVLRMVAGLEEISEGTIHSGEMLVNDVPPKDRAIAMVFQNDALYPHMSVFGNMAFGLRLRKMDKDEIRRRVEEAAAVLEITDFPARKPKAMSGGRRQRVAMGRAIVREPKAFLLDEPLSNLDAKLRVQMRTELGRLHGRLKTTTVYVTHDQVEAMTLGHRVAVLKAVRAKRPDNLQQAAPPSKLFYNPAMNMVNGHLEGSGGEVFAVLGPHRLKVDGKALERHPGLDGLMGRDLVIGIRPGDFEDHRIAGEHPERTMDIKVDVTEVLGSETFVHFMVPIAPVVMPEIEELLADTGSDASTLGSETRFSARVSSDVAAPAGGTGRLVVDTAKLHFSDPETGKRIGYRPGAFTAR